MFDTKPKPVELHRVPSEGRRTPTVRPLRRPAADGGEPRRRVVPRRSTAWQTTALFSLSVLFLIALGLAFHTFQRAQTLERELLDTRREVQVGLQDLRAGVGFDSARKQLLLGIRDEILRVNREVSLGDAYLYAEQLLTITDKYATVDPLLLLSIGTVESGYDAKARSHANARGLYQIWPATGRMLAAMLGWEYSDEMLFEPARNTEMAALYLDVLMSTYNDLGMVLAEYNGGPINAGYYKAGSHRTAPETRDYVPKVLEQYERLAAELPMAPGRAADLVYRDLGRADKRLRPAPVD